MLDFFIILNRFGLLYLVLGFYCYLRMFFVVRRDYSNFVVLLFMKKVVIFKVLKKKDRMFVEIVVEVLFF